MSTVLIVDDEYVVADILGYALEDEGYTVVKANSASSGLELFERDRPALVITDYMMPGMNGAEFASAIRSRPAGKDLPIILMSGAQGREGRANPQLFGKVFDKPFDVFAMLAAVAQMLPASD